jgi:hypothetical protein
VLERSLHGHEARNDADNGNHFGSCALLIAGLSPHLYLLGFEVAPYSELLKSISTEHQTKLAKSIEKSLPNDGRTPISNIQASLEIERREAELHYGRVSAAASRTRVRPS